VVRTRARGGGGGGGGEEGALGAVEDVGGDVGGGQERRLVVQGRHHPADGAARQPGQRGVCVCVFGPNLDQKT